MEERSSLGKAVEGTIAFLLRAAASILLGGAIGGVLTTVGMTVFMAFDVGIPARNCGGDPASVCPQSILDMVLLVGLYFGILGALAGAVLLSLPVYWFLFLRRTSRKSQEK